MRSNSAPDIPSVSGVTSARPLTHVVECFPGTKRNCAVCEEAKKKTEKGIWGEDCVWMSAVPCASVQR